MLSRVYFKCCPWYKWRITILEKINRILGRSYIEVLKNYQNLLFLFAPERKWASCIWAILYIFPAQTAADSPVCLKFFRNPDILKCEHFAGLRAQELKFVEVTVLRSRACFVYFKVNEKVCLLSCHTRGYFWRTVWKWVRNSSYFSIASLMHLWSIDLLLTPAGRLIILIFFSASSRGNWTDHIFRNKTRFAYWRRKSQYFLSRIMSSAVDFKCISCIRLVKA